MVLDDAAAGGSVDMLYFYGTPVLTPLRRALAGSIITIYRDYVTMPTLARWHCYRLRIWYTVRSILLHAVLSSNSPMFNIPIFCQSNVAVGSFFH